jgi:RNA polymerase sigma-70 factor (ECF subfamily)
MYYIAKQYLKRPTLAEDAVQDVFVKLWNKRQRIESSKPIRGLLFVMLKNHLINLLRKRKNDIVPISKENEGLLKSDSKSDQDLLYKEFHAILEKGLEELSDRKREVFELRTINGHTNSEVADLLHIVHI